MDCTARSHCLPDDGKMGKKSKEQHSRSKAKVGSSAGPDGADVSSSGTSTKKPRCKSCLCNLRDLAKARTCPGCHQLFCWRCERKVSGQCPNRTECVGQVRRCFNCLDGISLDELSKSEYLKKNSGEMVLSDVRIPVLEKLIADGRLGFFTAEVIPLQKCVGEECMVYECSLCLLDPADTALYHSAVCQRIRCNDCKTADLNADPSTRDVMALFAASAGGVAVTSDQMDAAVKSMRRDTPNKWAVCSECNASFCYGCLDVSAHALLTSMASKAQAFGVAALSSLATQVPGRAKGSNQFRCSRCYWKSKPCTNSNCPNEVGLPTKRCGGCHLDRYCSVECQAAAYPNHVEKCTRIQKKRAVCDARDSKEIPSGGR